MQSASRLGFPQALTGRTLPLAPPLPPGYTKGGGGVAGVPDFTVMEDGAFLEPTLTNAERRWLEAHDMPFPTANRVVVLRRIQAWDAEIAQIAKNYSKRGPLELSSAGPEQQELSPKSLASANNSRRFKMKRHARQRK